MRVGFPGAARPAPHDRNPVPIVKLFASSGVAPHGVTTRWTYTVPTLKKALLNGAFLSVIRATVAAPALLAEADIRVGVNPILEADTYSAVVDAGRVLTLAPQALLAAGDELMSTTADGSTGGTLRYVTSALVTEFDI